MPDRVQPLRLSGGVAVALLAFVPAAAPAATSGRTPLTIEVSGRGAVVSRDGRVDCTRRCTVALPHGAVVVLRARHGYRFRFDRWTGDCAGVAVRCLVAADRPTHVRAIFAADFVWVRATVSGDGLVVSRPADLACGGARDDCSTFAPLTTTVRLTARPRPGASFAGWSGACTGAELECAVEVSGDRAVTAAFTHAKPQQGQQPVTVHAAGAGHVTSTPAGIDCPPTCAATFTSGTLVTLATSAVHRWTGGCVGIGSSCSLVADAPVDAAVRPHVRGRPAFTGPPAAGLNVSVSPPTRGMVTGRGIRCGGPHSTIFGCQGAYEPGSTVLLRARPLFGSRSVRWLACRPVRGDPLRCRVLVEDGTSVEALFR